ncbi:MAG: futalosine synthase [Deltaproteobacteria bacterium]|nr:MAG: futalosine synthase [Deltaproteobacteria bacterium]
MTLTIGRISYLNTVPFFHHLDLAGMPARIVDGVPAELNASLAAGRIDLSPSSSFEYARSWRDYRLLPGLSISSRGAVCSVLLFSRQPLEAVAGSEIVLTGESATSVNLLQVLLREFCGAGEVVFRVAGDATEGVVAAGGSALLIGDRALHLAGSLPAGTQVYDLGELWYRFTGLPFVFALWIVRERAFAEWPEAIREFRRRLDRSMARAFAALDDVAAAVAPQTSLSAAELVRYWRDSMSYELTDDHLAGLRRFFSLCCKYGLLDEEPQLRFTD